MTRKKPSGYVIAKDSRNGLKPYSGPSCAKAGVTPGKVYDSVEAAQVDVDKLVAVNPVGFSVWPA